MTHGSTTPAFVSSFAMEEAQSYIDWTIKLCQSHLQGHVLEIGCGAGISTRSLLSLPTIKQVTAVDPLVDAIVATRERCLSSDHLTLIQAEFQQLETQTFDSISCSNVLEHIEDDHGALGHMHRLLMPQGTLALLVPAHPCLFSAYDRDAGHFRRYKKGSLRSMLIEHGFRCDRIFYGNALGAMGWLIVNKILHPNGTHEKNVRSSVRLFARYVQPLVERTERICTPPFGLSVIVLCTRV